MYTYLICYLNIPCGSRVIHIFTNWTHPLRVLQFVPKVMISLIYMQTKKCPYNNKKYFCGFVVVVTSTRSGGFSVMWFYAREHPKAKQAVYLVQNLLEDGAMA